MSELALPDPHAWFTDDWQTEPIIEADEFEPQWAGGLVSTAFPVLPDDEQQVTFKWEPLAHQIAPDWAWFLWLMMGGRGTGKTDAGAKWTNDHMEGPPCDPRLPGGHRMSIIAPTLGDAYESCVMGPSGLKAHNPAVNTVTRKGGSYVIWPNGAELRLFGASSPEDVERLRAGGNRCAVWCEELAAWRQLKKSWNHMRFGLRLGIHPQVIATTTPKPRKHLRKLMDDPTTAITSASTQDNPHLAKEVRDALYDEYGSTRLGQQELDGRYLTDVPGAITTLDELDSTRTVDFPADLSRRITMVDPAVTNTETSDDTGITVQGRKGKEVWLLGDYTLKADVAVWALRGVEVAVEWKCGSIWYEKNQGADTNGELLKQALARYNEGDRTKKVERDGRVEWTIEREVAPKGTAHLNIEDVPARLSKYDRALALQQAIQQKRWHIVGAQPKLEEELTTWTPEEGADSDSDSDKATKKDKSPNRMDAAVHGYRVLMGIGSGPGKTSGNQLRAARLDIG